LFSLAIFLKDILQAGLDNSLGFVANYFQLVRELKDFALDPSYTLVSLDVASLFTNVPIELAMKSIERRWSSISQNTLIPLEDFKVAVSFVLNSTFFTFNGTCYKQIFGMPMGSPLSPVIADLVLQDLELVAIDNLTFPIPFYYRYVDDIILAAPSNALDTLLRTFNSQHSRLQFTMEIEKDNKISFLDLTFINDEGTIIFDLYKKPTFSGRYLNYRSHHPLNHKKGIIYGLTDKIINLSHPRFHEKNFTDIKLHQIVIK